jgi:hypothetical protein
MSWPSPPARRSGPCSTRSGSSRRRWSSWPPPTLPLRCGPAVGPDVAVHHGPDALADAARGAETSSTPWSASPACRSRWPRSRPGAAWRWPTRSRSSPPARWCSGPAHAGRRAGAGRQRALRRAQCLRANDVGRQRVAGSSGWCSPPAGGPFRGRSRAELAGGHRRRRAGPPDVVDGSEDHRRLVDADEQGARGHRGPRAVRHPLRRHRGGRAPAVGRALDGGVHRRATIAQLSLPDMRLPSATPWPIPTASPRRSAASTGRAGRLDFEPPDHEAFPCLGLAYAAGPRLGGTPRRGQRRQRGRRGRLPRRRIRLDRHPRRPAPSVLDRHDGASPTRCRRGRSTPTGGSRRRLSRGIEIIREGRAHRPTPDHRRSTWPPPDAPPPVVAAPGRDGEPARADGPRSACWCLRRRLRRAVGWSSWSSLALVVMIFMHELGHYLAAQVVGA